MTFDARASMHTLRVWDAIMARPVAALPRLACAGACERVQGAAWGPPKYSLVARVKEVLESVGGSARFAGGLPRDGSTPTGYRRGCSPKELLHSREATRWLARGVRASRCCVRTSASVRSYELRYQE